jgi:DamX protein
MNMGVESNFSAHRDSSELGVGDSSPSFTESSLLGCEREQKLSLLLHLIVNLQGVLVLRGVAGVGKTRLLTAAASRNIRFGDIFLCKATTSVSFESLQKELRKFVEKSCKVDCPTLEAVLEYYAHRSRFLVLMIDDAIVLMPGLIKSLIELSMQNQALRLVFSFTPEDYLIKSQTENLDGQCHFIELPELNLLQCKLFLQQIINLEKTVYAQDDIDAAFVNNVYMATKGVPGAIRQLIVSAQKKPFSNMSQLMMISVVVVIASAFVNAYLWNAPEIGRSESMKIESVPSVEVLSDLVQTQKAVDVLKQANNSDQNQEVLLAEEVAKNSTQQEEEGSIIKKQLNKPLELASNKVSESHLDLVIKNGNDIKEQKEQKKQEPLADKKVIDSNVGSDDAQWVFAQNSRQYTLQLMVLSDKKKLLAEQEKYFKLGYKTFFIERKSKKTNDYVLLYGRYPSINAAKNAMQKLPKELRNSWPRRFGALQKSL